MYVILQAWLSFKDTAFSHFFWYWRFPPSVLFPVGLEQVSLCSLALSEHFLFFFSYIPGFRSQPNRLPHNTLICYLPTRDPIQFSKIVAPDFLLLSPVIFFTMILPSTLPPALIPYTILLWYTIFYLSSFHLSVAQPPKSFGHLQVFWCIGPNTFSPFLTTMMPSFPFISRVNFMKNHYNNNLVYTSTLFPWSFIFALEKKINLVKYNHISSLPLYLCSWIQLEKRMYYYTGWLSIKWIKYCQLFMHTSFYLPGWLIPIYTSILKPTMPPLPSSLPVDDWSVSTSLRKCMRSEENIHM